MNQEKNQNSSSIISSPTSINETSKSHLDSELTDEDSFEMSNNMKINKIRQTERSETENIIDEDKKDTDDDKSNSSASTTTNSIIEKLKSEPFKIEKEIQRTSDQICKDYETKLSGIGVDFPNHSSSKLSESSNQFALNNFEKLTIFPPKTLSKTNVPKLLEESPRSSESPLNSNGDINPKYRKKLEGKISQLSLAHQTLKVDLVRLNKELELKNKMNQELNTVIIELRLTNQNQSSEIFFQNEQIKEMKAEIFEKNTKIDSLVNTMNKDTSCPINQQNSIENDQSRQIRNSKQIELLENQLEHEKNQIKTLRSENQKLQEQIFQHDRKKIMESVNSDQNPTKDSSETSVSKVNLVKEENRNLKIDVENLSNEVKSLKSSGSEKNNQLISEIQCKDMQLTQLKSNIETYRNKQEELLQTIRVTSDNNKKLREDLCQSQLEQSLTKDHQDLKQTRQNTTKKYNFMKNGSTDSEYMLINENIFPKRETESNRLCELTGQLEATHQIIKQRDVEILAKTNLVEKLHEQVCELSNSMQKHQQVLKELEIRLEQSETAVKNRDEILKERSRQMEILNKHLIDQQTEADLRMKQLKDRNQNALDELKRHDEILREKDEHEIKLQNDERLQIRNKLTDLEREIFEKKIEVEQLNEKLVKSEGLQGARNTDLFKLKEVKKALTNKLKTAQCELAEKCRQLETANTRIKRDEDMEKRLNGVVESKLAELAEWSSKHNEMLEQNKCLVDQITERDELTERLSKETAKLKNKCQNKTNEIKEITELNADLKGKLCEYQSQIELLNENNRQNEKQLLGNLDQINKELINQHEINEGLMVQIQKNEDELNENKKKDHEKQAEMIKLIEKLDETTSKKNKLEKEQIALNEQYRTCRTEITNRNETCLHLKTELGAVRQEMISMAEDVKIKDNQMKIQLEQIKELREENLQEMQQIDELHNSLNESRDECAQFKSDLESKERTHLISTSKLERKITMHVAEIESLKENLASITNELKKQQSEESSAKNDCIKFKAQLEMSLKKVDTMKETIDELKQDKARIQDESKEQTNRINCLEAEIKSNMQQKMDYERREEDLKQKEIKMMKKKEKLLEEINLGKRNIENLQQKLDEANSSKNNLQGEIGKRDVAITNLEKELRELQKKLEENSEKIAKYQNCLTKANEQLVESQEEISVNAKQLNELGQKLSSSVSRGEQLESEKLQLSRKVVELEKAYSTHCEKFSYDNDTFDKIRNERREWKHSSQQKAALNTSLQGELDEARNLVEQLQKKLADLETQLNQSANRETQLKTDWTKMEENFHVELSQLEKLVSEKVDIIGELEKTSETWKSDWKRTDNNLKCVEEERDLQLTKLMQLEESVNSLQRVAESNESLQSELVQAKQNELELSDECNELKRQLDAITAEFEQIQLNHEKFVQEATSKSSETMQLHQQEMENCHSELADRVKQLIQLESCVKRMSDESEKLQSSRQQQDDEVTSLKAVRNQLRAQLDQTRKHLEQQSQANRALKEAGELLRFELEQRVDEVTLCKGQLEEQELAFGQLQNELKKTRDVCNELQSDAKRSESLAEQLSAENANLTTVIQQLELRHLETKNETDKKLEEARRLLDREEQQVRHHKEIIQMMEMQSRQAMQQLEDRESDQKRKVVETRTDLEEQRKLHTKYKAQSECLQSKLDLELQNVHQVRIELEAKKHEVATLSSKLQEINQTVKPDSSERNSSTEKTLAALAAAEERANHEARDKQKYQERLENVQSEFNQILLDHKSRILELEQAIHEKENIVKRSDNEKEQIKAKLTETRMDVEEMKVAKERMQKESEGVMERINKWMQEQKSGNESLAAKIREQNKTIEELQEKLSAHETELEASKTEALHWKNMAAVAEAQTEKINQMQSVNLSDKNTELSKIKDEKSKLIAENNRQNEELRKRIDQLQSDSMQERKEAGGLRKKLKEMVETLQANENTELAMRAQIDEQNRMIYCLQTQIQANQISLMSPDTCEEERNRAGIQFDKDEWKKRAVKLSSQLQHNNEFWTNKLNEVTGKVVTAYRSSAGSPSPSLLQMPQSELKTNLIKDSSKIEF